MTHVLDQNLSATILREQVVQITNTSITYIFDVVSFKETQQATFSLLTLGGTLAVITQPQVNGGKGNKKDSMVIGSFNFLQNHILSAKFSIALTKWLEDRVIKVCIALAYAINLMLMELG